MSSGDRIGLLGILLAVGLRIGLAFRGFSLLLAAPAVALPAVAFSGGPLLASLTQTFMPGAARSIARGFTDRLGSGRAILAVVLACALLTYGGVSLFVVSFAVFPIADALFRQANIPHRLIPATIALGAFTFTMTALPVFVIARDGCWRCPVAPWSRCRWRPVSWGSSQAPHRQP